MTTLATDDFNRANAGTLGANWVANTGAWGIVSNQASATSDDSLSSYDGGVSWPANQWSQATMKANIGTALNSAHGMAVRCSTLATVDTGYVSYCSTAGTQLYLAVAGSFTSLGTETGNVWAANDVSYLEAQSTTVLAKRNGTTALSATDATLATGRPGLEYGNGGTASAVDDWSGGDFAGGTTIYTRKPFDSPIFQSRVMQ